MRGSLLIPWASGGPVPTTRETSSASRVCCSRQMHTWAERARVVLFVHKRIAHAGARMSTKSIGSHVVHLMPVFGIECTTCRVHDLSGRDQRGRITSPN